MRHHPEPVTPAYLQGLVDEMAPRVGVDAVPVVTSEDPNLALAVTSRADGVALALTVGHPFLDRLDLRSAVAHELFHVRQMSQGFPLVHALTDAYGLAAQVQNAVTDLHVTGLMAGSGFSREAELITTHRLDALADLELYTSRYGLLPVITRLPVVTEEVLGYFPRYAERLRELSERVKCLCPADHWAACLEIGSVLRDLREVPSEWAPEHILDAYRRIFVVLSPRGRFSLIPPLVFLITEAGDHLR